MKPWSPGLTSFSSEFVSGRGLRSSSCYGLVEDNLTFLHRSCLSRSVNKAAEPPRDDAVLENDTVLCELGFELRNIKTIARWVLHEPAHDPSVQCSTRYLHEYEPPIAFQNPPNLAHRWAQIWNMVKGPEIRDHIISMPTPRPHPISRTRLPWSPPPQLSRIRAS